MNIFELIKNRFRTPLVRNTLIYTAAGGLNASIPFFILPILTHYLTPTEYGIISTFMVFNSVFVIFIGVEQQSFISVNYFSQPPDKIKKFVSNVFFVSGFLFLLFFLGTLFFSFQLEKLAQIRSEWIIFSIIVAFAQFITQLHLTLLQLKSDSFRFGVIQIGNSIINYGTSILLIVQFEMAEAGRIWGIILSSLLFAIISLNHLIREKLISFHFDYRIIRSALLYSFPLIPHAFAGWINTAADRIIINTYVGVAETGIYTIGFQVAMIVTLIASSFNKAFVPILFERLTKGGEIAKHQLVRYTYYYFMLLIVVATLLTIFSFPLLRMFATEDYYLADQYIYWIVIGFTADGLYYGVINYIYFTKRTFSVSLITFSGCLIHFIASIILIPQIGALGGAYSTAISYWFTFLLAWVISNKIYPMPWFNTKIFH